MPKHFTKSQISAIWQNSATLFSTHTNKRTFCGSVHMLFFFFIFKKFYFIDLPQTHGPYHKHNGIR